MVLYLTSSFIPYQNPGAYEKVAPIDGYGFFDDLKKEWPKTANLLYVPCDPDATEDNKHQLQQVLDALEYVGLAVNKVRILDDKKPASSSVKWANIVYLAGGHAPTQLNFMRRVYLKEALLGYNGIVIGLSAGSINAAFHVYHMPERDGEATDPNYIRFSDGLDLTNIQIIPHRDWMRDRTIDGLSVIDDILIPDSFGTRFYMISDGSYFKVKNRVTTFVGDGEIIEDGVISPLKQGPIVPYMSYVEQPVIRTLVSEGYDMVFAVEINDERCEVYFLSETVNDIFEQSRLHYRDICQKLSEYVVKEERKTFLDEMQISVVKKELAERGKYVRTVHVNSNDGHAAKNIRIKEVPSYPDWLMVFFIDITATLDYDWQTNEYATTGFMDRARVFLSELPKNEHYSLVYANVKGLKAVNELFGHQKGDLVIFQTRDALRKYLRPIIMGRLENDHFVLITADENLTEKNLKSMSRQVFKTENIKYSYEIHCGIYPITNRNTDLPQMLSWAKLAENRITGNNRNHLYSYFDDSIREKYVKQRYLLSDYERALADGEFMPYYQPIVNAKTGEVVSAEMLIRWQHRDLGMVSPSDFIPIIESEGKTSALDRFMLERGTDFMERRTVQGKKLVPCAINLSRVDFYDHHFIENIFEFIKGKKIDPAMVRFEITESAYTDLESKALDYLNKMKKHGIQILLDDYGSGMSSLSMLETFDFDIIKLDISFIRKIGINKKTESIIVSTIKLAHAIGAKVTAEGVESEKQLKFLQDADVDYIQGYYFYKPLPEVAFENLLD